MGRVPLSFKTFDANFRARPGFGGGERPGRAAPGRVSLGVFRPDAMASPEPSAAGSPEPSFEQALEELEGIIARMEDGKLPLEESLAAYQRGAELVRFCEAKLSDAQARIAVLEGESLRDFIAEPK